MKTTITQKSPGKWRVDVSGKVAGVFRRRRVTVEGSRSEAQARASIVARQLRQGEASAARKTLEDLFPLFIDRYPAANNLSPNTVKGYRQAYDKAIGPLLGTIPLDDIGPREIEDFKAGLADHYSTSTINRHLQHLATLLNYAHKMLAWRSTPPPSCKRMKRQQQHHVWRDGEVKALTVAATDSMESDPVGSSVVFLGLHCGLRVGEIIALQRENVELGTSENYPDGCITVKHSQDKTQPTKSKRVRIVPLTKSANQALRSAMRLLPEVDGYVLASSWRGGAFRKLSQSAATVALQRTYTRAGLEWKGRRLVGAHSLRHSFASALANNGVSTYAIMQLLGHARLETTERYLHSLGTGGAVAADVSRVLDPERESAIPSIGTKIGTVGKSGRIPAARHLSVVS